MDFTNKTLVIIDVGTDDDTGDVVFKNSPGAQTWYVHIAAFVFFCHYLVDSIGKDMRQKCLISFFFLKCLILCFFPHKYTLNH